MFGTHFITDIMMGSRVGSEIFVSQKEYQAVVGSGSKLDAHLQFRVFGINGKVEGGHSESLSESNLSKMKIESGIAFRLVRHYHRK